MTNLRNDFEQQLPKSTGICHTVSAHCQHFDENNVGSEIGLKVEPNVIFFPVYGVPLVSDVEQTSNQRECDTGYVPASSNQRKLHTMIATMIGLLRLVIS